MHPLATAVFPGAQVPLIQYPCNKATDERRVRNSMMCGDDRELFSDLQTLLLNVAVRHSVEEGALINTESTGILKQSERLWSSSIIALPQHCQSNLKQALLNR